MGRSRLGSALHNCAPGVGAAGRDLTRETVAGFTGEHPDIGAALGRMTSARPRPGEARGMGVDVREYMSWAMAALEG